ncbi:MAG: hypothetical protein DCC67_13410 [Planctomycetota bacterium]|nr:MAG: hypothetical protein DCC67_13410 [Planctomycetota bacterium]
MSLLVGGAALMAGLVGCRDAASPRVAVFPVIGRVTFQGQPAAGAVVALHRRDGPSEDAPTPRASIDKDGTFRFTTFEGGDGAPVGQYVLTIQWHKLVKRGGDVVAGPNVMPRKYASPRTSDKLITVAAGENDLKTIQL